jgi:hypothetical protein
MNCSARRDSPSSAKLAAEEKTHAHPTITDSAKLRTPSNRKIEQPKKSGIPRFAAPAQIDQNQKFDEASSHAARIGKVSKERVERLLELKLTRAFAVGYLLMCAFDR